MLILYRHLFILFSILWGVPLLLTITWSGLVQGCSYPATRHHLGHFCIEPFEKIQSEVPWYLDLWNTSRDTHNLSEISISPRIESIMTSPLQIRDTEVALRQQMLKLRESDSSIVPDEALQDLGKSYYMPPIPLPTHYIVVWILIILCILERLIPLVSDLHTQLDNFSSTFCMERDIMSHAFRGWVDTYSKIVADSDFVEFSLVSLFLFPQNHGLRFFNHFFLVPFLPKPRIYNVQVKAEIQFQRERFLADTKEALGNIDGSLLSIQSSGNSSNLTELLGAATRGMMAYQQNLDQNMNALKDKVLFGGLIRTIFGESQEIKKLKQYHALVSHILVRLGSINATVARCEVDSRSLKVGLSQLRRSFEYSPNFEFSPAGFISIPPSLSAQLKSPPFTLLKQSSGFDNESGSKETKPFPSYDKWEYDLDKVISTNVLTRRTAIADWCQDGGNYVMRSGFLYTVCNIWSQAKLMSTLDDDLLSGVQRSWIMEREKAIHRYEKTIGLDFANIIYDVLHVYDST